MIMMMIMTAVYRPSHGPWDTKRIISYSTAEQISADLWHNINKNWLVCKFMGHKRALGLRIVGLAPQR